MWLSERERKHRKESGSHGIWPDGYGGLKKTAKSQRDSLFLVEVHQSSLSVRAGQAREPSKKETRGLTPYVYVI